MKRFIKLLLITLMILVVAIVAAPFFVRQEQIRSFIENKVILPDGQKLKLEGDIIFGLFPYMHVKVPQASVVKTDGSSIDMYDLSFGFNLSDLTGDSISFDSAFRYGDNEYGGNFYIKDYNKFLNEGVSPVVFKLEKPLHMQIEGDMIHQDNIYSLRDFKAKYKQTEATGTIKATTGKDNFVKVEVNTEIDSQDIENIRRVIEFGKNKDDFNMLSGIGKVKLNVETQGVTEEDFKANLNGEGDVTAHDAAIYGIDINELIGAPQQTKLTHNSDRKIDIREADSEFTIANGIIKIESLSASNQFANITGHGTVSIPESTVNMGIDIDADIASAQVKIPLLMYGTFEKIKFAPRNGDILTENAETIKDLSKIKLKDVKIKLGKKDLNESVKQLRELGKGFGIDLDKVTKGATKDMGVEKPKVEINAPVVPVAAPAAPATDGTENGQAPASMPASKPASMK